LRRKYKMEEKKTILYPVWNGKEWVFKPIKKS
jgi:hypothetical protein